MNYIADNSLISVLGGGGEISKACGREGKPFIGRDFTKTISEAAPVVAAVFPPAGPVVVTVGSVAAASNQIEKHTRD